MSVSVENLEKSMAKITVEVPAEDFEKAMQEAYQKQKGSISIPGFRKGKVPRQMIEKMYGPAVFYEEAANSIIPDAYADAAKNCGLDITSRPEIDVAQIEKGKPFIFTAMVAVRPEVKLGQYKGVEIPKLDASVSDEDVQKELEREQERNSRQVTLDDEAASEGDIVTMDYEGKIDGVAFSGGTANGADLTLGSGSFIPGFEDQLIGVKAGETREVKVSFPEDYPAEDLKGREAVFTCNVLKVSRKEKPELNDEFAQDVSEFDTLEEYREDLRKKVTERKEEEIKQIRRDNAVSAAAKLAEIEIPKPMMDTRCEAAVEDFAQRLLMQGMNIEQYMQYTGSTREMVREQLRPQTELQVRNELVLEEVAKVENVQISDEELDKEIEEMAKTYSMDVDEMKKLVTDDEKESLRKELGMRKAIDIIADAAVEVETPEEENKEEKEGE